LLDTVGELTKENEQLRKQVGALIETHPNVAMYRGVLNRPETKKK